MTGIESTDIRLYELPLSKCAIEARVRDSTKTELRLLQTQDSVFFSRTEKSSSKFKPLIRLKIIHVHIDLISLFYQFPLTSCLHPENNRIFSLKRDVAKSIVTKFAFLADKILPIIFNA